MILRTIHIDENSCDGCGLCVKACHEGALKIVDGKARLVNESLCDGIGDCLPACPRNAISFVEKDIVPNLMAVPSFQWPIKLALISPAMPLLKGSIIIASDCTGFVMDHIKDHISNRPMLICCPKLEPKERFDKIYKILAETPIDEVEVLRMDIPCCSILTKIIADAIDKSGKKIELKETIIGRDGRVFK